MVSGELSAAAGEVSGVAVATAADAGAVWGWVETETKWAGREMVIGRANVKSIDGRWRVGCGAVPAGTVGAAVSTGGVFDILFAVRKRSPCLAIWDN